MLQNAFRWQSIPYFFFCWIAVLSGGCQKTDEQWHFHPSAARCVVGSYTTAQNNDWVLEAWFYGGRGYPFSGRDFTLRLTAANPLAETEAPKVQSVCLEMRKADTQEVVSSRSIGPNFILEYRDGLLVVSYQKRIRLRPNPGWVFDMNEYDDAYKPCFAQPAGKYHLKATVIFADKTTLIADNLGTENEERGAWCGSCR